MSSRWADRPSSSISVAAHRWPGWWARAVTGDNRCGRPSFVADPGRAADDRRRARARGYEPRRAERRHRLLGLGRPAPAQHAGHLAAPAPLRRQPQGRRPAETGVHGCTLVQVDEQGQARTNLVPTDAVRWLGERVVVDGDTPRQTLEKLLCQRLHALLETSPEDGHLMSWTVAGEGPLIGQLRRGRAGGRIVGRLARTVRPWCRPAWSVSLEVEASLAVPPEWYEQETIRGDFLRAVRQLEMNPERAAGIGIVPVRAASGRHAGRGRRAVRPPVRQQVFREAAWLGVDLLSGDLEWQFVERWSATVKITALEIDGYGVWSGLRVERLSDGSTWSTARTRPAKPRCCNSCGACSTAFRRNGSGICRPVHGGRPGGSIDIDTPHGAFQLSATPTTTARRVIVTAADGTRQGEHVLKVLLSDIDEAIFNNVFAVGLREIQELGTLGDTQAADLLYNLASGLDRVSLVEVMHALQESRNRILNSSGGPCQLSQLLHEREKLRLEVEELSTLLRRYGRLAADRGQLDRDVTRLEEEKNQAEHQALAVELSIGLREPWQRRQALDDELAALGPQVDVPDGILPRLDAILVRLQKYERRRQRVAAQRKDLRAEAGGLAINEALARHAARIAALQEQETWMQTLSTQVGDLQKEIAALESALAAEQKRLGLGGLSQVSLDENGTVPVHGAELSRRAIERLRVPGRALQQGRHRWKKAREEAATAGQAAQTLTAQLQTALAAHEAPDVATATDRAGNLVAQLRRRTQVDERLDQLTRNQTELTEESQHLLGRQLLPGWILAVLGGAFVLGVVLILAGLLLQTSLTGAAGWLLALLGVAGAVLAAGGKFLLDRSHDQQYETGQRQLTMLAAQIKQAKEERDVLDTQLPHGGGPLAVRLTAAEKELAALEELLPVDTRRAAAAQSSTAAATQADAAQTRTARRIGHGCNRSAAAGLPPKVLPRQITQLLSGCEQIQELARRLSARREELQQRRRELDLLHGRIAQLVADTGVAVAAPGSTAPGSAGSSSTGPDPAGQLRQLGEALNRQHGELARREAIRVELRQWRRRQGRWAEAVARCKQQRRVLFRQAGVEDEAALRQRAGEAARAAELRRERSAVDHDIVAAIGGHCSQENVRQFLTRTRPPN